MNDDAAAVVQVPLKVGPFTLHPDGSLEGPQAYLEERGLKLLRSTTAEERTLWLLTLDMASWKRGRRLQDAEDQRRARTADLAGRRKQRKGRRAGRFMAKEAPGSPESGVGGEAGLAVVSDVDVAPGVAEAAP